MMIAADDDDYDARPDSFLLPKLSEATLTLRCQYKDTELWAALVFFLKIFLRRVSCKKGIKSSSSQISVFHH